MGGDTNSSRYNTAGFYFSSPADYHDDDIERRANNYFHQLFSGHATTDAMIQMLARFKESTQKSEQAVFRCMILNLFMKSNGNYPEEQLQLSGVLFGSLIKNQIISRLMVDVALQAILRSLCEFAGSKMFMFGIRALSQFVDRLIEWPAYCNHILQMSHLCATHPGLFAFIGRALSQTHVGQSPAADVFSDGIEAEALFYLHEMFGGRLTIDAMIEMLAHFKDSVHNREQAIFRCIIVLTFNEFEVFDRLPKRQLKTNIAFFVGSLVKNQLVTDHALDIVLQVVLDSLREPADSKIFVFGITALAQFVDRLMEWPHYCNRILQISHLRAVHPELVAFIERARSRVSLAHPSHRPAATGGYANDIEAEATLYFQQMFSGQLSGDAVIQMLTHFKGSADNRDRAVFRCMLVKLFREYKIYTLYPERQLQIAGVFLESLVANQQVITHPRERKICIQAKQAVLEALDVLARDAAEWNSYWE